MLKVLTEYNAGVLDAVNDGIHAISKASITDFDIAVLAAGLTFYRCLSERIMRCVEEERDGASFAEMPDDEAEALHPALNQKLGYWIPPTILFCNVCARAPRDSDLPRVLSAALFRIGKTFRGTPHEKWFSGLFDDVDFQGKGLGWEPEMRNNCLRIILKGISDLHIHEENDANSYGDVLDHILENYASENAFNTEWYAPSELIYLLSEIAVRQNPQPKKLYDPGCGDGALLLKVKEALTKNGNNCAVLGQEFNATAYTFFRMKLLARQVDLSRYDISFGNALLDHQFQDRQPFGLIVTSAPRCLDWPGSDDPSLAEDRRYRMDGGVVPRKNTDSAYIMHVVSCLAKDGAAVVTCNPGLLFRKGPEYDLRKFLVRHCLLDTVIHLPKGLFRGRFLYCSVLILKHKRPEDKIFFVNATQEYWITKKHRVITNQNLENIIELCANRDNPGEYTRFATREEIAKKHFDLAVKTYVKT